MRRWLTNLEFGLGLALAGLTLPILWLRTDNLCLSLIFALAWAWLMWGPNGIHLPQHRLASLCRKAYLLLGPMFIILAALGPILGNYLLWLKVLFYIAVTCRLAYALHFPRSHWTHSAWLCVWALLALFPMIWSSAEIDLYNLLYLLLLAGLWAALGTLLLAFVAKETSKNLLLALLHLGPLPPLALAWPDIACWLISPLALILFFLRYSMTAVENNDEKRSPLWLPPWLLDSAFLCWWCLGCALCITLAWWLPGHHMYFEYNAWLKAISLGLFLILCLGLLLEYSMPLLGRPEPQEHWRGEQSWGPMLSALTMLLLLLPTLLLPENKTPDVSYLKNAKAVLLDEQVELNQAQQQIDLSLPEHITSAERVYIVSRLVNGQNLPQGQTVAMLVVMGESGLPAIYPLRAGIDSAEQNLGQSRVMALAQHQAIDVATQTPAFSADGQAYYQQSYISGFFLLDPPEVLRAVSLHYADLSGFTAPGEAPACLVLEKVTIE